jgi:hypothetical protein
MTKIELWGTYSSADTLKSSFPQAGHSWIVVTG